MPAFAATAAAPSEYAHPASDAATAATTADTVTDTVTDADATYFGLHLISRVSALPVVNSAVGKLGNIYESTKSSSDYVKRTLESVEGSVAKAAAAAKPLIQVVQPTLREFDSFGCRQLDRLEESLPIIRKPAEEILADSRRLVEDVVVQSKTRLDSIREANEKRVKEAVRTVVDGRVKPGVELLLTTTETAVERYLPLEHQQQQQQQKLHEEEEGKELESLPHEEHQQQQQQEDEAEAETYTRVRQLSNKVQRRLYGRAMNQLKTAQLRSQQTLQSYKFTVDLIQYAHDNIDRQARRLRSSLESTNDAVLSSLAKGKATVESLRNGQGLEEVRKSVVAASELVHSLSKTASDAVANPRAAATALKTQVSTQAAALQSRVSPYAATLQTSLAPYTQTLTTKVNDLVTLSQPTAAHVSKLAQENIATLTSVYQRIQKDLSDVTAVLTASTTTDPKETAKNAEAHAEVVRLANIISEGLAALRNLSATFSNYYLQAVSKSAAPAQQQQQQQQQQEEVSAVSAVTAGKIEVEAVNTPADAAGEFSDAQERLSEDDIDNDDDEDEEEEDDEDN